MDGRRFWFWAGCLLLPSVLVACSTPTPPQQVKDSGYVLTVSLKATDTQAEVLQQYGGEAVVWRPEAGFAILKLSAEEKAKLSGEISAQTETNSSLKAPEVSASGYNAWGGGWNAWGGGWNAWGGGWNAWGGGTTNLPALPGENRFIWNQIFLPHAFVQSKNFGAGMKVAVIDTGIDVNHPMFSGRLAPSTEWKDFVDGDANPGEVSGGNAYGHGTAVSGIILQMAPKAKILPIRVLKPDGLGDVANVAAAIDWAVQKGAKIINLSLGTNVDVTALKTAVNYATSQHVYVVASAGNEGSTTSITYPAAYANVGINSRYVISVGSVKTDSTLSSFSNRGTALKIAAPGERIYSAYPGNQIGYVTGTSFAAPVIAGMLALLAYETNVISAVSVEAPLLGGSWPISGGGQHASTLGALMSLSDFQRSKSVLFVVGNTTLNSGDTAVKDEMWNLGYNVVIKSGASATSADATGKAAVVISSTVNSADVGTKFKNVTAPVLTWEAQLFDDMGMVAATSTDYGTTTGQTNINFVNTTHPLSGGLNYTYTGGIVFNTAETMTWGKPTSAAVKIATLTSDTSKPVIFGYDTGAQMVGLTAPGRRVALMFHDSSASNISTHWASAWFFNSALTWAISGN